MANAKQCDECGALYLEKDSPNSIKPTSGKVKIVILQFRVGKDHIDLCNECKIHYSVEILKTYQGTQ